jgi:hypothetical protein
MGRACSTHIIEEKCILVGKIRTGYYFGRSRYRQMYNIKMNLRKLTRDNVHRIHMVRGSGSMAGSFERND